MVVRKMETFGSSPFLPPPALMIWRRENERMRERLIKRKDVYLFCGKRGGASLGSGETFFFSLSEGASISPSRANAAFVGKKTKKRTISESKKKREERR